MGSVTDFAKRRKCRGIYEEVSLTFPASREAFKAPRCCDHWRQLERNLFGSLYDSKINNRAFKPEER